MILGAIVAAICAWVVCFVIHDGAFEDAPGWLCTVAWVVAIVAWLIWAFPNYLRR